MTNLVEFKKVTLKNIFDKYEIILNVVKNVFKL